MRDFQNNFQGNMASATPKRNFIPIVEKLNLGEFDFVPFGGSSAVNVLETFLGTPDIVSEVSVFMGLP